MTPRCSIKGCPERPRSMGKCDAHLREWQLANYNRAQAKKGALGTTIKAVPVQREAQGVARVKTALKPLPKRKANGDAKFFRALYETWVAEERNFCIECGCWLRGEAFNFAHVVGDGECGGNREVGLDVDNVVPACRDCHTWMDQGLGGKVRQEMQCFPRLQEIRRLIVDRYQLKVARE